MRQASSSINNKKIESHRRELRSELEPEALLRFLFTSGKLKSEPRRGWVKKLNNQSPESVADHSYRTALMAMIYGDMRGLDVAIVIKMALLHDLPEAIVGDATPEERSGEAKILIERNAMKEILKSLPSRLRTNYERLWFEFATGSSKEAKLVRELDKLEMAVQAKEYLREGYDGRTLKEFMISAEKAVRDDPGLKTLQSMLDEGFPH